MFLEKSTTLSLEVKLYRSLDSTVSCHDSDLPVINTATLQDPKMTIHPSSDTSSLLAKSVRINNDNLVNLSTEKMNDILSHSPFTRIVLKFPYLDDDTLRLLNEGLSAINHNALPNIQGSIRSYSLEAFEKEEAIKGTLDIISGFMILDDDIRLVVLEGLAKPNGGIMRFYTEYLPKLQDNTETYSILCNPSILFSTRLYPEYCPDLKRIRIRGKLEKLAKKSEIYNHRQVDINCFNGIDLLMSLLVLKDMKTSKAFNIYPLADSLNKIELLYGEAISRTDMDGTLKKEFLTSFKGKRNRNTRSSSTLGGSRPNSRGSSSPSRPGSRPGTSESHPSLSSKRGSQSELQQGSGAGAGQQQQEEEDDEESQEESPERRKREFTDCRNPEFESYLQHRPTHRINHLKENIEKRKEAYLNLLYRRERKQEQYKDSLKKTYPTLTDEEISEGKYPHIHTYSTQSENYKIKVMNSLREEMKKNPTTVYTMSPDFISQTICIIDEDLYLKKEINALNNSSSSTGVEKTNWLTAKGFLYPKPKTFQEIYEHPKKPTLTRIDDLKEPFLDILDKKPDKYSTAAGVDSLDLELFTKREKNFHTQFHLDGIFGGLSEPQYEKEFELSKIGHPSDLPRGKLLNKKTKNSEFFQSVFIGGEKQQQMIQEAEEKDRKEWESKVIVDNKTFQVGHFVIHDKPLQFQRYDNILRDPPKKKIFKDLYEKKGFETTPLSVFVDEPYAAKNSNNTIGRDYCPEKFMTAKLLPTLNPSTTEKEKKEETTVSKTRRTLNQSAKPQDFIRYLNPDTIKGDLYSKVVKKKHATIDKTGFSGPYWEPPSSN
jgi:hypothetical protein